MLADLFDRFAEWALSKNPGGFYRGDDDGRWAFNIGRDDSVWMTRITLPFRIPILGVRPMLNGIRRRDVDRHLHKHPWKWALSIVLTSSYEEVRLHEDAHDLARLGGGRFMPEEFLVTRAVRWFNFLRAGDYHKITAVHGTVWTLFIAGPSTGDDWGFLVDGRHVDWREYQRDQDANHAFGRQTDNVHFPLRHRAIRALASAWPKRGGRKHRAPGARGSTGERWLELWSDCTVLVRRS